MVTATKNICTFPDHDAITTVKHAKQHAHSLSDPSKMPGYSYGTPAEACNVGSKLRTVKGSVCEGCYAFEGFYKLYGKTIKPAQYQRLDLALNDPHWVDAMTFLINKYCYGLELPFRWHDSGDIQSIEHLEKIVQVCRNTPDVMHWLPTREYKIVKDWLKINGAFPDNLVVRISAHMIDKPAPNIGGLPIGLALNDPHYIGGLPTSTVVTDGAQSCPASKQDNKCLDCRMCWNPLVKNVSYGKH